VGFLLGNSACAAEGHNEGDSSEGSNQLMEQLRRRELLMQQFLVSCDIFKPKDN